MKHILFILLSAMVLTGCFTKDEDPAPNPETGNPGYVPADVAGQWLYGTFSMTEFWGYDGSYQGNAFELSVAFDFKTNGTYEMYFASEANYYGCRTDALTYTKGNVDFKDDGSFIMYPTEGNYRGFYSCTPLSDFNRPAESYELEPDTLYYTFETDEFNKKWMVIRFNPADEYPSYFAPTHW